MVKSLLSNQIEERRNNLTSRLADALIKNGQTQICPKLNSCSYVVDNVKAVNMGISEAHTYIVLICEQYFKVCELNIDTDKK